MNEAYENTIKTMTGPIAASDLPDVQINYKGLLEYAEKKGVPVIDLSESEKSRFVKKR